MIITFLKDLKDFRRGQGRMYQAEFVILFSIMAILSNSKSYRDISRFISKHFEILKSDFELKWKKAPAYTTIRNIIQGLDQQELEKCFRNYSASLIEKDNKKLCISGDGKALRGSFDNFNDKKMIQKLSFFETTGKLILAHEEISEKSNEIPAVQHLLETLNIGECLLTLDAMHCQKKLLKLQN